VRVLGIGPHMHLIGKAVKIWAVLPDGRTERLIGIRDWQFTWQGTYRFATPVSLPAETVIHAEWSFDNSAANPANPSNPPRKVTYGENSTDEMAGVWIEVAVDSWQDDLKVWGSNLGHIAEAYLKKAGDGKRRDP
jgi:hypothetical protein